MYRRTFGDSHIVLSIAYSVYTAASIFLLEIQALKYAAQGTLEKLKICIFALEGVRVSSPGMSHNTSSQLCSHSYSSSLSIVITTALSLVYQEIERLRVDHNISLPIPQQDICTLQPPQHLSTPHSFPEHFPDGVHPTSHHVPRHQRTASSISQSDANIGTPANQFYVYQPSLQYPAFEPSHAGVSPMAVSQDPRGVPDPMVSLDNPASYEITPEIFEAFSYAEPITTNMTPAEGYGWMGNVR